MAIEVRKATVGRCDVNECGQEVVVEGVVPFGYFATVAMNHGWSFVSGKLRCPVHAELHRQNGGRDQ